jgi:toxin CptA
MPNSPDSSTASARCRLSNEAFAGRLVWKPSRLLSATLVIMGLLAGLSVIASEMPLAWSLPLASLALGEGVRQARREMRRPERLLVADGACGPTIDGLPVTELGVQWRGPLAFVRYRDADRRWRRLAWWPDTLGSLGRRELRLAVPVQASAQPSTSMAP